VNYLPSSTDFANPERGFYRYSATSASNYTTLDSATLADYRTLHMPFTANYSVYSTLVFRYFILDDFKSSNISQDFLDSMAVDFATARAAGVKLIPRFTYTTTPVEGSCPAEWVCPPYGDAEKVWVLAHINQLKPVLMANADVIATVQMGFIGIWGENYYTDHFGDASVNGQGYLSSQNWTDRKEVLEALLDALPPERMVQVRYPQMKQKYVHGNAAPTTAPSIDPTEAHSGSDEARIGLHNDCLLSGPDDFGTYFSYDNSPFSDTANLKPYFANEGKYVVVGGETCSDTLFPFNDCAASGGGAYGDTELRRMRYSYLNADYNNDVNNDWVGICLEDIKKNLGYRFVLENGTYSNQAQPGQVIDVDINLKNEGYAAPFNPRGVELVLRNISNEEKWYAKVPQDPRFWLGNGAAHAIEQSICLPPDLPIGEYELLLNLPDPEVSIYDRPEYAIRLANGLPSGGGDVWETGTGYNQLGHSLTVNPTAGNAVCAGEIGFIRSSAYSSACVSNLNISGVAIPSGKYQSTGEFTSSDATVKSGHSVLFQSDTGVSLTQNFTVEAGAELEITLQPCPSN
jgi:hypothetical protein